MPQETIQAPDDQQTENRILAAAQQVFVRRGIAGARTQDIAEAAGVNRALINYYFRSKQKLAEAVFIRAAQSLFPRLLQTLASDLPLREKLTQVVDFEIETLSANPFLPLYVLAELQYHPTRLKTLVTQIVPLQQIQSVVLAKLQHQLDAEAEAGRLRPTKAEDLIVLLMSTLVYPFAAAGMIELILGLDETARAAMLDRRREDLADFILRGLSL